MNKLTTKLGVKWRGATSAPPQNLDELKQKLLDNRGICHSATFFNPPHPSTIPISKIGLTQKDMNAFTSRMRQAGMNGDDVLIFGDYDADGICATGILWEALHSMGVKVRPFLPDRFEHGYGFSEKALQSILTHSKKPDLIITVDNGIVAHSAMQMAKNIGIEIILSDHHQPENTLPAHDLLLHTTILSGAGIAWFMARELSATSAEQSLDLVSIATLADQMKLLDVNRSLVWHGLKSLQNSTRPGLRALFDLAKIDSSTIDEKTVGFVIAPRINAMGRLGSPLEALRLICTHDVKRAHNLAFLLDTTNSERQQKTQDALEIARMQAQDQNHPVLVIHSPEFHEGVIGLIAGKLAEEFAKPTIVLSVNGDVAKGSARSLPGINIVELMRASQKFLLEVGGHPLAGGCSLKTENIALFKESLVLQLKNQESPLVVREYELPLLPTLISEELLSLINSFAPFGIGNSQPIFKLENWQINEQKIFGKENNHLKISFKNPKNAEVIYWQYAKNGIQPTQKIIADELYATLSPKAFRKTLQFVGQ